MLYYLFHYLDQLDFPGAGMFKYISFRSGMALIFSLFISTIKNYRKTPIHANWRNSQRPRIRRADE